MTAPADEAGAVPARTFAALHHRISQLEQLNRELESRASERAAALESSNARLSQSEQGRALALAAGDMGSWSYDHSAGLLAWDEGHSRIFGVDATFAPTLEAVRRSIHPEDLDIVRCAFRKLTPARSTCRVELRAIRPNGEVRWCSVAAVASFDERGRMVRVSGVTIDVSDRKDAELRLALLAREVDHRARNALAVVQAIVRLARADTVEGYVRTVEGRIRALALTHELLSQSRWQGADLHRLVTEAVAPYRSGARITTEGPSMVAAPETAQIIALTLHELATNAAEYGALSSKDGELDVRWFLEDGLVKIFWSERGGLRTRRPASTGFGIKIILANFNSLPRGSVDFDWREEGLLCRLAIPRGAAPSLRCGAIQPSSSGAPAGPPVFGKRLLLVEDEPLIASLIHDMLADWGFEPTTPYCRLNDALAAARNAPFDGAILDLDLNGESVYPLAELLASRSIPFVFLAGYSHETVDRRFEAYPVLQKPVAADALEALLRGRHPEAVA